MNAVPALVIPVAAYLLGSVSWSVLVVRLAQGRDVRTLGSGNAGATNVLRAAGKTAGLLVLLLDLGKGVASVAAARALGAPPPIVGAAAVAVVVGHIYPIFFGFRGGKGVATAAGALGALAPLALAMALLAFALVVAWKHYVSLASVAGAALFPLFIWVAQRLGLAAAGDWLVWTALAIAALVIVRHGGNLRRLRRGTEPRLGERRAAAAPAEGEARD